MRAHSGEEATPHEAARLPADEAFTRPVMVHKRLRPRHWTCGKCAGYLESARWDAIFNEKSPVDRIRCSLVGELRRTISGGIILNVERPCSSPPAAFLRW
jgi:hypothetical protein